MTELLRQRVVVDGIGAITRGELLLTACILTIIMSLLWAGDLMQKGKTALSILVTFVGLIAAYFIYSFI